MAVPVSTRLGTLIAFALLWLSFDALAQSQTGTLVGVVNGTTGQRLSSVQVSLSREDVRTAIARTTTDKSGHFEFVGLSPGRYTIDLSLDGWTTRSSSHLEVRAGSTLDLAIVLSPLKSSSIQSDRKTEVLDNGVWWGTRFGKTALHDLPTTRRVWSLLESQETSTVTDKLDIGGLQTGRPALVGAHGASWTENQYFLNGFNLTDPYVTGRPLTDPEFNALADVTVVTAVKPSLFSGSGVSLSLATPQLPNTFHGAARSFFSNHSLQSDNLDARLIALGFPGPERLGHLLDESVQLGGRLPLSNASLPFFVDFSTQLLSKDLGGFAAPIDAHTYQWTTAFTPFSRDTKSFDLLYSGQHIFNSREGADPLIEPSATGRGNDNFNHLQGRWHSSLASSYQLDAGFGITHAGISSSAQPDAQGISTIDLPKMKLSGPIPLTFKGERTRYEANILVQTVQERPIGIHSLNVGVTFDRNNITNSWNATGGIQQVTIDGVGAEVTQWNVPATAHQHTQNVSVFVQDAWRPAKWLAFPYGLRFETTSGRAESAHNGITWTTVEPRAGMVIPLGSHGLILRSSWSRYGHVLQGRYLDFGNAASLGGQIFRWQDFNGNGRVEADEITGLLRVFGGPYSIVDQRIRRPFTDEISAGLDQQIGRSLIVRTRFFRRDDHRLIEITNQGVPASSYTPASVTDPGNDGLFGTADDQTLMLFNRNPSALGKDLLELTNPSGYRASEKAFEFELVKSFADRAEVTASFVAMQTSAPTNPGNSVFENDPGVTDSLVIDPNTLLFVTSRTFFDRAYIGKLRGYYRLGHGLGLGAIAKYYDGLPFGRMLFVNGFNQGPFFVRATPRGENGAFRTQLNSTLDVRASREFTLRRGNLNVDVDIFNLLNLNKNTVENDLTSPTFAERVPLAIQAPRVVRFGLEWNF